MAEHGGYVESGNGEGDGSGGEGSEERPTPGGEHMARAGGAIALSILGEAAGVGAWIWELDEDRFTSLIDPTVRIAGRSHALEQLVRHPEQVLDAASAALWRVALKQAQGEGSAWDLLLGHRLARGDGWLRMLGRAEVLDGRAVRLHGVVQDVTVVRKLERQLVRAQKVEVIGELSGGIVHELKNVLNAIAGMQEAAVECLVEWHPAQVELTGIAQAVDRGVKLTRQLLSGARVEMDEPVELDVAAVVDEMYSLLRRALGPRILVELLHSTELRPVVAARGEIEQVILNLALNARDAMPEGGNLTLTTRNVHSSEPVATLTGVRPAGAFVELAVQDTGHGMDPRTRARIFEPFFTTKRKGRGSGLGLPTCLRIIEQAGGLFDVESVPGQGATFRVWLPALAEGGAAG